MKTGKKILLISPHFYPEDFKCNDVAFELAQRGYEVTVLSDIPNYPGGKFFKGYGLFSKRRELVNGVRIIRTAVIPRGNGSGIRLALNYLSFAFTASLWALFLSFKRFDAILVHETSPITVGIPALVIKFFCPKTQLLFWVLDLWPESLQVAGGINNKKILGFFEQLAKLIYRKSDKILISSNGFKSSICAKGDFANKIVYFPNWAEASLASNKDYILPELPHGFKIMFAGNIGEAQDFEHTLLAIKLLYDKGHDNIHLILVGDGRKKSWVEEYVRSNGLEKMVHCVGRHPLESMGQFFAKADVLYLALKDSMIFNLTCPAKLQAYMSAGKPILAMINGEGGNIISDAQCGFSVPAGDSSCLAETIIRMSTMDKEDLKQMGSNAGLYLKREFSFESNMAVLEKLLNE
ncbi:MAG: glycosyltransferase family 4 protein [Bacteroidales bacterium]|nr:glycosyltransferase family 4 protein [Bacteroidales bacterium]